jgi:predicted alpha/beta-fold hydrolase
MRGQQQRASELPLRIVDQPGGAVIRCLCGHELATLRRGVTGLTGMRRDAYLPHLAPDITAAGLVVMVAHAKACAEGRRRAAELHQRAGRPV